jgi:hypothetical protein
LQTRNSRIYERIRPYWQICLAACPPIRFELIDVYTGVDTIVIYYCSVVRKAVCEALFFNDQHQIVRDTALDCSTGK